MVVFDVLLNFRILSTTRSLHFSMIKTLYSIYSPLFFVNNKKHCTFTVEIFRNKHYYYDDDDDDDDDNTDDDNGAND